MSDFPPPQRRSALIHAVGDLMFDCDLPPARVFYHRPDVAACDDDYQPAFKLPYLNTQQSRDWLVARNQFINGIYATSHLTISRMLSPRPDPAQYDLPFDAIRSELLAADVVFGNLECPLSRRGRRSGNDTCYRAAPEFADAMARAGFNVISLANNHMFDYGEPAFLDTLKAVRASGMAIVGAGETLPLARSAAIRVIGDLKIAFLAYSMHGQSWGFATDDESGVAPLNPMIVAEDVGRIRRDVDFVIVSVHWGLEYQPTPYARQRELAHELINCGVDVIFGHHSHVPGSIEIYRGRPIFYSLGNFVFGHTHDAWGDNMLARLRIEDGQLARISVVPVTGVYQPCVARGEAASRFCQHLGRISAEYGTEVRLSDGEIAVKLPA